MYADVVFPLKLHPLTYKLSPEAPSDVLGRIVAAPLLGKTAYGIIAEISKEPPSHFKRALRPITEVYGRFGSASSLLFLKWLAEHHLAPAGLALKSSFFEETVKALKAGDLKQPSGPAIHNRKISAHDDGQPFVPPSLLKALNGGSYKTFLFQAPSPSHERRMLCEALEASLPSIRGVIVLVPEMGQLTEIASMLGEIAGERLCILHGKLTPKRRSEAVRRILYNASDVIIGTRSAIFAPLERISLISVLGEHSTSYKAEEGLRYNGRDVAVMRGFLEKATVLLSSICPSLESVHNSRSGKYVQLFTEPDRTAITTACAIPQKGFIPPKIRVIGLRGPGRSSISPEVLKKAKETLALDGRFLFLSGRKGYSLIRCEDCGHIVSCDKCRVNLVYFRSGGLLRCGYCGLQEKIPDTCKECEGVRLSPFGTGTERIRDELREGLNMEALLADNHGKGSTRGTEAGHSPLRHIMELAPGMIPLVVGTPGSAGKADSAAFSGAALLDMDLLLSQPDFRAYEKAFQEVLRLAHAIMPGGTLFLQTRNPGNILFGFIKNHDLRGFQDHELAQRQMVNYPPFSRIILFNIFVEKNTPGLQDLLGEKTALKNSRQLEALGPIELPNAGKPGEKRIQIMLKSIDKRLVHKTAKELLRDLEAIRGIRVVTDVDPYRI